MQAPSGRILVTGGAGFIGSHLVERLLSMGHTVVVIDDLSTGSLENLRTVQAHPSLTILQTRVSDCGDLAALCAQSDFVFHLAAAVGVELVMRSPVFTIETNLTEAEMIFEAAAPSSTPVLLASTSEVYGKSVRPVFLETDDLLIGPPYLARWSYACSKLMDEFLGFAYFRERNLPVIIARLFNTVGPRQTGQYGMVLPRFVEAALSGNPLQVHGTGEQTRCFCDVQDTVEALVRLMRTTSSRGEIFNIGTTEEISIRDLARRVIEQTGSRSEITFIPYHQAYQPGFEDMQRRVPSIEKLGRVTGFQPGISLDQIIRRMAQSISKR